MPIQKWEYDFQQMNIVTLTALQGDDGREMADERGRLGFELVSVVPMPPQDGREAGEVMLIFKRPKQ